MELSTFMIQKTDTTTHLVVLRLPPMGISSLLEPPFILWDCEEIDALITFGDLQNDYK